MVGPYAGLLAVVAVERCVELGLSYRNACWSFARGAIERGQGHFAAMKVLHAGLLCGCLGEGVLGHGRYSPVWGPLWLTGVVAAQLLRYWAIATLGRRWNIRVIVLPHLPPVRRGPYAFMRHPNYLAVALEGIALPMLHGAVVTAAVFTMLNVWLLRTRIACEDQAIATICGGHAAGQTTQRHKQHAAG